MDAYRVVSNALVLSLSLSLSLSLHVDCMIDSKHNGGFDSLEHNQCRRRNWLFLIRVRVVGTMILISHHRVPMMRFFGRWGSELSCISRNAHTRAG